MRRCTAATVCSGCSKSRCARFPAWQRKVTVGGALTSWLGVLGPYWLAPILLVTTRHEAAPLTLGAATLLYAFGVALMLGSDAQKYDGLDVKKGRKPTASCRWRGGSYLRRDLLYVIFAVVVLRPPGRPASCTSAVCARCLCRTYVAQGSAHVALPRVGCVQGAHRLPVAAPVPRQRPGAAGGAFDRHVMPCSRGLR